MTSMKVSIVTISFNQARFLEQSILSVITQDYPDIEYIVVDPGSTDGSREIIEKYRDHIARVIFEPDNGPADGLNKGFAEASGEVYAFLNSDDMLHPRAVSRFVDAFKRMEADVISGHGYIIDDQGKILRKIFSNRIDPISYVFGACVLVQPSTFFRAQAFHQVGGFNVDNPVSWDGELWFDMALAEARFGSIFGYWSYFRLHPESITVSDRFRQEEEELNARLASRIGISKSEMLNPMKRRWYWLKTRMLNPFTTLLRLLEALRVG